MAWLKDCEICNTGLCKAVDERKEQGKSERTACKELSEESEGLYSTDAILGRYRWHTGKKQVCHNDTGQSSPVSEDTPKKSPAWTKQMRMVLKSYVDSIYWKHRISHQNQKNLNKIIRKLSKESEIPYKILRRWYDEEEEENNERLKAGPPKPKTFEIITIPKGKALEYAPLSLNIYKGCTHSCEYCYAPNIPGVNRQKYYSKANPKDDVEERLSRDIKRLKKSYTGDEILLSFMGDVYQPEEMNLGLTRKAIKLFIKNDINFTILTKGGSRAQRDFDLLESYDKSRFGTTLIFLNQDDADHWEPEAATIQDRIETIKIAHSKGIKTWVSIEPVIDPDQALQIIKELHPIVDKWKVGKLNYNKEVESKVDWLKFRTDVTTVLDSVKADYYLKKSLTEL